MAVRPNIAIFVLDSVRGDWVSKSPTGAETFGGLMELARRDNGLSFDSAHAHSITSPSSMGSLATGLYPFQHGLAPLSGALTDDIRTVAERLTDAGYHTIGVSANTDFSPHTNLDKGFETFRFLSSNPIQLISEIGIASGIRFGLKIRSDSAGLDLAPEKHTVTPLMNTLVEKSVQQTPSDQPFYLLAQYIEPHTPYYPPRRFLKTAEKQRQAKLAYRVFDERHERMADGCRVTDEEWKALEEMYAVEIQYTAAQIQKAIQKVTQKSSRETIFIVTADHGDLFGEQGFLFHGQSLHNNLTHVPLITCGLEIQDPEAPTTHVDVIRTLVELAGGDAEGLTGIDLRRESRDRFVTQRPYEAGIELIKEHNPDYENDYCLQKPVTAFHKAGYKMKVSKGRTQFFYTDGDSREEEPLEAEDVPGLNELQQWSEEWFDEYGRTVHGAETAEMYEAA